MRYAEASLSTEGIRFSHISRVPLPEEALERGVPSDPTIMATLIKAICQEKKIPAHRAAVVLSPEVAYQRVIKLPRDLTAEQAFAYICDPANAIPLPFPLDQTDFDLYPLNHHHGVDLQSYLLIAVPQPLIDSVINLLSDAGFELQALELGPFSLMRFLSDEIATLGESGLHLVLELLPDCSQLCVVGSSGPIRLDRLSAIRDFPDPDLDDEQRQEALSSGLSAESIVIEDERYLPISELDLRAVVRDVRAVISELKNQDDSFVVSGLTLSGINSAHPLLQDLFHESLDCPVQLMNPVLMPRVSGFTPDDLLVQAGLARLMGLGLGFLPREQLLNCSEPVLLQQVASTPTSSLHVDSLVDAQNHPRQLQLTPLDVEVMPVLTDGASRNFSAAEKLQKRASGNVLEEVVASEDEEEWPSVGLELTEKAEEEKETAGNVLEEVVASEDEEEWPSINAIPDLQVSESLLEPQHSEPISSEAVSEDSSSLGELRFQDQDE